MAMGPSSRQICLLSFREHQPILLRLHRVVTLAAASDAKLAGGTLNLHQFLSIDYSSRRGDKSLQPENI
jgi:hypothetical protein